MLKNKYLQNGKMKAKAEGAPNGQGSYILISVSLYPFVIYNKKSWRREKGRFRNRTSNKYNIMFSTYR